MGFHGTVGPSLTRRCALRGVGQSTERYGDRSRVYMGRERTFK